jgi:hypothetical protein
MNVGILEGALIGAVGGLLIAALFVRTKKYKSLSQPTKAIMSRTNDSTQSEKSLFDNWSIRLALVGIGLGIFSAFAKGYTQIGFMIGFAIPMSLIGLVVGFVIDLCIKPSRASTVDVKTADVGVLPSAQSELNDIQISRENPRFVEPQRKEFNEKTAPSRVKVASADGATLSEQKTKTDKSVQTPIARWYKSDHGIGDKRSDLYFMDFEIKRLESPEVGYKILHPHPRKEGQVVPRFVFDAEIEQPRIRGGTVTSSCPNCKTVCSSPNEQNMYFKCADCQTSWWQKR